MYQLAQETSPAIDFVQYGVLGLVIMALLFGWLWAKPAVDRLLADKERAEKQRDELVKIYNQKVLPALRSSTQAVDENTSTMNNVTTTLAEVAEVLGRIERESKGG